MYMNVDGHPGRSAPRRGSGRPHWWRSRPGPPRRPPAAQGAAGAGLSCLLARASGRTPGPGLRVCVGRSLRRPAGPAGSCLPGTAGAGLGAHALVARSRHDSLHSAQISPYLRSLAAVVLARVGDPAPTVPGSRDPVATPMAGEGVIAVNGRLLADVMSYPAK